MIYLTQFFAEAKAKHDVILRLFLDFLRSFFCAYAEGRRVDFFAGLSFDLQFRRSMKAKLLLEKWNECNATPAEEALEWREFAKEFERQSKCVIRDIFFTRAISLRRDIAGEEMFKDDGNTNCWA